MLKIGLVLLISLFFLTGCGNNEIDNTTQTNTNNENLNTSYERTSTSQKEETKKEIVEQEISSFQTKIYTKEEGRQNNMNITASKVNGYIVKVGETFSFTDIVGKATTAEGYMEADIFDHNGNKMKGLGGR